MHISRIDHFSANFDHFALAVIGKIIIIKSIMVLMKILRDEALCSEGKSLLPALDEGINYQGKGAVFYQVVFMMIIRILRI